MKSNIAKTVIKISACKERVNNVEHNVLKIGTKY